VGCWVMGDGGFWGRGWGLGYGLWVMSEGLWVLGTEQDALGVGIGMRGRGSILWIGRASCISARFSGAKVVPELEDS
jgi:hypothetical protein